jgi:ligand-binding sensor domain-containing protein/signal transduction histidine kinase
MIQILHGRKRQCGEYRIRFLTAGLAGFCLLLWTRTGYALDPSKTLTQYTHRVWNQEEGLLEPTIYSMLQSRDGYLWLGTQTGLIRFDGERFRQLKISQSRESDPILVRSLYEDTKGNLWAGSIGDGLLKASKGHRQWFTTREGLPSNIVTCLVPDKDGVLWVCTSQGLVDFRGRPTKVYTTRDGLPSNHVSGTCFGADGTQWVSTIDRGLSRKQGQRFLPFGTGTNELAGEIRTLRCGPDGTVWAGTDHGLYRIRDSKVDHFTSRNGLADDAVSTLELGNNGSVWVGTQTGITRFQNDEWNTYGTRDGLSHTTVLSLLIDREGSLWVGTKNGVDQFTDTRVTPYTTSEGMPSNDTGPVVEDQTGILWTGTRGSGLVRFDGRRFTRLTRANGLLDNQILSLAAGADGDLWVGTVHGLNRLRNGRVTGSYTRASGLPGNQIISLFKDSDNALWVGTEHGLSMFDGNRFVEPPQFRDLRSEWIVALGGGRLTRLFASTSSGRLYCLRSGKVLAYTPSDPARAIASYYPDLKRRSLWMGTLGTGLLRLKNGALTHIRVKDGLFDDQIYAILPDDHENFWFASSKGIFRVSREELEQFADRKRRNVTSFPFSTGQLRFECQSGVNPAAWRTKDGRLWFSTTNGLVAVDPNHLQTNVLPPPAQIETVFVNGQRREPGSALSLSPFEKNLEIRYAGLSFVTPEKVTFRYILDGYDKEWIEAGSRREAFYTNLPPGHFRFRVIACNSDGIWSTNGASLDFTIEPLLYQRRWFFPVLGLLIALLVWLGYQVRIRRLRNQFNLVLSERSRIARELHDTLLQGVSGITMQLQALWTRLPISSEKRVLEEIIKDAGTCLTDARRSLWGLRTPRGTESDMADRLTERARQAINGKPIRLILQVAPPPHGLSPEIEYQLLRIAQEAIANSIRHGAPKTLEVRLEWKEEQVLELMIRDDGKGFSTDVEHAHFGHYGLVGMRERADEIGAKLVITSIPGFGTEVTVLLKTTPGPAGLEHQGTREQESLEGRRA